MSAAMPDAASRFSGLTPLLSPRSIAVLGASSDATRIGGRPIAYLKSQGFKGAIYPVNPNRTEVQGVKAYPSVAALPETPDVAIIAVGAEIAPQAVEDLAKRGTKAALMFTAGFAEVDDAGAVVQSSMVATARQSGMRILGPNCLGVFDARTAYYATFSTSFDSGWPVLGRIGIASQSGAYGTHLYTLARNRAIGASLCIMTGNEADVTVGECIGWLAENPEIDVIAIYLEGIRKSAEPPRRAGSGAGVEEAGDHAEGRSQRTRRQGGEVAHRLDRRRRCGDRSGDARVRRGARPQLGGDAGHRPYRHAENLSGGQHAGRDHGVRWRGRADQRRRRPMSACRCRKCQHRPRNTCASWCRSARRAIRSTPPRKSATTSR